MRSTAQRAKSASSAKWPTRRNATEVSLRPAVSDTKPHHAMCAEQSGGEARRTFATKGLK